MTNSGGLMLERTCRREPQFVDASTAVLPHRYTTTIRSGEIPFCLLPPEGSPPWFPFFWEQLS